MSEVSIKMLVLIPGRSLARTTWDTALDRKLSSLIIPGRSLARTTWDTAMDSLDSPGRSLARTTRDTAMDRKLLGCWRVLDCAACVGWEERGDADRYSLDSMRSKLSSG